MAITLTLLAIVLAILIYKNLDWIAYMWKEHVVDDFPADLPPFCFDCKAASCQDCELHQLWKTDPEATEKLYLQVKFRKNNC